MNRFKRFVPPVLLALLTSTALASGYWVHSAYLVKTEISSFLGVNTMYCTWSTYRTWSDGTGSYQPEYTGIAITWGSEAPFWQPVPPCPRPTGY